MLLNSMHHFFFLITLMTIFKRDLCLTDVPLFQIIEHPRTEHMLTENEGEKTETLWVLSMEYFQQLNCPLCLNAVQAMLHRAGKQYSTVGLIKHSQMCNSGLSSTNCVRQTNPLENLSSFFFLPKLKISHTNTV